MLTGIVLLLVYLILCVVIYFFTKKNYHKKALAAILLLALVLRVFMSADMYLHEWDERFHAVVAKNMMVHPLKPTLYDNPVLDYDHRNWASNHLWLSKPPLAFWAMGASMAIFGVNEVGLRLPSILFSLICVWLTMQIGTLLFNRKTGLLAGFFHAIHGFSLELAGGIVSADHVDVMFLMWVQVAVLFMIKFIKNENNKYLFTIGLCAGLAYLCKWIMALFVLLIWLGIYIYTERNLRKIISKTAVITITFLIVILPWQLFILYKYPKEAAWIFQQMFAPIQTVSSTTGHTGGITFYSMWMRIIFGELIYIPVIWLIFKCFNIKIKGIFKTPSISRTMLFSKKRIHLWILFVWIFIPLILLTFSAMKKDAYLMISASAYFILTAFFVVYFLKIKNKLHVKSWISYSFVALMILLPIRYSIERVKPFKERMKHPEWRVRLSELDKQIPNTKNVILSGESHYLNAMFYHDFVAYERRLSEQEIEMVKGKGYRVFEYDEMNYTEK